MPGRYPFLLESAAGGPLDRYSLLLRSSEDRLELRADGSLALPEGRERGPGLAGTDRGGDGFLEHLDRWYRRLAHGDQRSPDVPFAGGWFLYLGYELAGEIEPRLDLPPAGDGLPVALAVRCEGAVLIRHGSPDTALLVAETEALMKRMLSELADIDQDGSAALTVIDGLEADAATEFEERVHRIKEYLLAGDVFQVNLSRGWRGHFSPDVDPVRLYRGLRGANPAPFGGFMLLGDRAVLSSSPERLVEVRGRDVQTRPIAGTHPRALDPEEDRALARRLLAHPKERAEHIMLIDLERNDLGRVCEAGSVEVDELMVLETYAHVHHIVSNVRGRLRPDLTPVDALRAVFPGGTITGCPKVRCMEIIAELEGRGRGFYTGSMGYLDRYGNLDMNILIRSMLLDSGRLSFRTGAGIVADSDPRREVAETVHKARGLLAALGGSSLAGAEVETC
jgi:anthranilate synthase component 1